MAISAGLAAVIGAGISAAGSLYGTAQRNEAQRRESELAYAREKAAIKEQNAYNTPSAQMARLQAAGLNPNLMYETSKDTAAGLQSDVAHYQPAEIDNAFEPMANTGSQMIQSLVGLKDMQNKTMLAESQALVNASTAGVNWSKVNLNEAETNQIYELLQLNKSEIEARVKSINSQTEYNEKAAAELVQRVLESRERIKTYEAQVGKLSAEQTCMLALLPSQIELNKMTSEEKAAAILKAYEETRYIGAYYYLDSDKLEFNKYSFEKNLEFEGSQKHWDRRAQYWDMGLRTGVQILGMGVQLATKGGAMSGMFDGNPWTSFAGRKTFGSPSNSPEPVYSPSWNRTHPRSKRK